MGRPHRCKGNERKRILGGGGTPLLPASSWGGCWREGHYSSYLIVHHGSSSDFQEGMVWGGVTIAECESVQELNSGDLQLDFWGGVTIIHRLTLTFLKCSIMPPGGWGWSGITIPGLKGDQESR